VVVPPWSHGNVAVTPSGSDTDPSAATVTFTLTEQNDPGAPGIGIFGTVTSYVPGGGGLLAIKLIAIWRLELIQTKYTR